jgi:hypothetical protein
MDIEEICLSFVAFSFGTLLLIVSYVLLTRI